jgi:ATP-dependent RNA helicase DDX27
VTFLGTQVAHFGAEWFFSSVTLVGEADRKVLKTVIKHSGGEDKVGHRVIPADVVSKWKETLLALREEVEAVLQEEKEEKAVSLHVLK